MTRKTGGERHFDLLRLTNNYTRFGGIPHLRDGLWETTGGHYYCFDVADWDGNKSKEPRLIFRLHVLRCFIFSAGCGLSSVCSV